MFMAMSEEFYSYIDSIYDTVLVYANKIGFADFKEKASIILSNFDESVLRGLNEYVCMIEEKTAFDNVILKTTQFILYNRDGQGNSRK